MGCKEAVSGLVFNLFVELVLNFTLILRAPFLPSIVYSIELTPFNEYIMLRTSYNIRMARM
jgi:hypothetical protein